MTTANYIDIGILIIILLLGIRGLKNGLIHEIMGVIGIVLGIFIASKYCLQVGHYLKLAGLDFENETIIWTLAFILILSCIWIAFLVVGAFISRFVIIMPELAIVNYFGGYVFAALKYFVLLCIFVYALSQIGFLKTPINDYMKDTKSYPIIMEISQKIMSLDAIEELKKDIQQKEKEAQEAINKKIKQKASDISKALTK
ncbi:CvpA family protein [Helicobacter didelphidarum]|uniref:CvpA family protein n=1 Tax=Helicobacter didelphidarum TaxID=2040648 RepID=A0A3D8IP41_9HELI|nr:CvpA family protein [Helicobacter didelphidarum]RDU66374.1 CvpA family protein [Helicobacter didelphidarum]